MIFSPPSKRQAGAFIGALLLSAACAHAPPTTSQAPPQWDATVARLAAYRQWEIRGRAGIRVDNDGGPLSLHWLRNAHGDRIEFAATIGKGLFQLQTGAAGATARDDKGRVYRAADAQTLLAQLTGWQIPINGLQYWVRGIPTPEPIVAAQWNEAGRLQRLDQDGWEVHYSEYVEQNGEQLPRKLRLIRGGTPVIDIKLIIEQWNLS